MKRLSAVDGLFLSIETPTLPMHVGALHLLALPAGPTPPFIDQLRERVRNRLPVAGLLRQRLAPVPLQISSPAWAEAWPDLRSHIVAATVPPAVRADEPWRTRLEAAVARLHAVALDRSLPLWKMHVFEDGPIDADGCRRVAVYSQLHHAAADGQAAVALLESLYDAPGDAQTDTAAAVSSRGFASAGHRVEPVKGLAALRTALRHESQAVLRGMRQLPAVAAAVAAAAVATGVGIATRGRAAGSPDSGPQSLGAGGFIGRMPMPPWPVSRLPPRAPRMRFNGAAGAARAFATASLPLSAVRAWGRAQGLTVNDVLLLVCGTALRRHLSARGELPRRSLVAAVAASLRAPATPALPASPAGTASPISPKSPASPTPSAPSGDAGNRAAIGLVSLGTALANPAERLAQVRASAAAMKSGVRQLKPAMPLDAPSLGLPWLVSAAVALGSRLNASQRLPPLANLVISHVRGTAANARLAGARVLAAYPVSIVIDGLALNITVHGHGDVLDIGLVAGAQTVPDLRALAAALVEAFDELLAMPAGGAPSMTAAAPAATAAAPAP